MKTPKINSSLPKLILFVVYIFILFILNRINNRVVEWLTFKRRELWEKTALKKMIFITVKIAEIGYTKIIESTTNARPK